MKRIDINDNNILEHIEELLLSNSVSGNLIDDTNYHHNCSYNDTSSILKNGILSLEQLANLKGKPLSEIDKKHFDVYGGHVNGYDNISLSLVGLTDLYRDEEEYDPTNPRMVDLRISSNIKARRNSKNYGNEFLVENRIDTKDILAIDLRILKLIKIYLTKKQKDSNFSDYNMLLEIINDYNSIKKIASTAIDEGLDIPLRELSSKIVVLDKESLSRQPNISFTK